jgi:quinol monooxygenase YgiN
MIIYEVNLEVQPAVADAFAEWLPGHIEEVLALPGFVSAELFEEDDGGARRWSVRYTLESEAALRRYFEEFADMMRADGKERFGDDFSASRRVLRPLRSFGGDGGGARNGRARE